MEPKNNLLPKVKEKSKEKNKNKNKYKEVSESDLKKTIRTFKENEQLQNKINQIVSKSNRKLSPASINKKDKPIDKIIIIKDIADDEKYKQAAIDMQRNKLTCAKLLEMSSRIDQKIKMDNLNTQNLVNNQLTNKQIIECNNIAQGYIDEVKKKIDVNNFDINTLNEKDKKLLLSRLNYKPIKRKAKTIKDIDPKTCNDFLIKTSINSIQQINDVNKNLNKNIYKHYNYDFKEEIVYEETKYNNLISESYINNLKKGNVDSYYKVKKKLNKEVNTKEDFFDYIYFYKNGNMDKNNLSVDNTNYSECSISGKSNKKNSKVESHPFLIYD